jgi:uncharacterized membrane-anchored protein YitT (DUF2179 family)
MKTLRKQIFKVALRLLMCTLGVLCATLGIEGFLLPNGFIDGGITGVSMLLSRLSGWNLPLLIVIINAPFVFLAYRQLGFALAIASVFSILGLACGLQFFHFAVVTQDKLLAAVFGGSLLGAGIGLSIRAGSVLDGTEVLALLFSRRVGATVGDLVLLINILIFASSLLVFGPESAMYSILAYLSASRTVDFVIHGIEEYTGITIVSSCPEKIRAGILQKTDRGVTVYKGKGGFSDAEQDILFCVVTRLEIVKIKAIVEEMDSGAFMVTHPLNEASGGMVKAALRV